MEDNSSQVPLIPLLLKVVCPNPKAAVWIYALHPTTRRLVLWKVSLPTRGVLAAASVHGSTINASLWSRPLTKPLLALIVGAPPKDETIMTSLLVHWPESSSSGVPMIVIGTSRGDLYWVLQTKVPISWPKCHHSWDDSGRHPPPPPRRRMVLYQNPLWLRTTNLPLGSCRCRPVDTLCIGMRPTLLQ
jgi:hypothetical protein